MASFQLDDETPILVDFTPVPGMREARPGTLGVEDLAEKSAQAVDKAMGTIKALAHKIVATINKISDPPEKVEVTFGLKLDAEAGALIAKAGTEASFSVKLAWEKKPASQ